MTKEGDKLITLANLVYLMEKAKNLEQKAKELRLAIFEATRIGSK